MRFDIKPRSGLGKISLGMSRADVTQHLGPALDETVVEDACVLGFVNAISVMVREDAVFQIAATRRNGKVFYQDLNIFVCDPFQVLQRMEKDAGNAFECYGYVVFPRIGVTLTGFHDDDQDQKAVTVYQEGTWQDLEDKFVPISFQT